MRIYLDHNATSPLLIEAQIAMAAAIAAGGNPSSVHAEGRAARQTVEEARGEVAALVNARPAEIVFTSGGTEANALALRGCVAAKNGARTLLVGATEHDSILTAADDLAAEYQGLVVRHLAVDRDGRIDVAGLGAELAAAAGPVLVSVMHANNETGVLAPLKEIVEIVHAAGALVHVDAAQACGRVAVDFRGSGVDLMSISAHKFGGPRGAGALVVRDGVVLARQIAGGGQELGRRAGTENVPAIAGFGAAAAWARGHQNAWPGLSMLRTRLEAGIRRAIPSVVIHGAGASRLPNTSLFGVPGVPGETQVMGLDLAGFAISSGAACSSGKVKESHVLIAMGAEAPGDAIRVSLGPGVSEEDIDSFIEAWARFVTAAMARRAAGLAA